MAQLLGILLLSFSVTAVLLVPFIDFLFKAHLSRQKDVTKLDTLNKAMPIHAKLLGYKGKRPIGGGVLVVLVTTVLSLWSYGMLGIKANVGELAVLMFTMISFALLGLYDDIRKNFNFGISGFFGLRLRHKLVIQIVLGLLIGAFFWFGLGYDFVNIHWFGSLDVGILFIPIAAFVVVSFANAYNITDGLDGLSTGILLICLMAFLALSSALLHPALALFIAVWIGALIAFLYFNIYPARVELGDSGALAFGATLAVVGLLTGKILALTIIGGVFIVEVLSSLVQLLSKHYLHKKVFTVAPLHLWFMYKGWKEPKVVVRFWLAAILFAIFGLWLGVLK